MRRLLALAAFLFIGGLLCIGVGRAQLPFSMGSFTPSPTAPGGFSGPGDALPGVIKVWNSIIPFSTAYAAAAGASFDWSCNSGSNTGTMHFQASGVLDATELSSLNTTCGVSTINVTLIDQSGANFCQSSTPCSINSLLAGTLTFVQSGCPATSVITYCLSASGLSIRTTALLPTVPQPFTGIAIYDRPIAARGADTAAWGTFAGIRFGSQANDTAFMYDGVAVPTTTMTDGALHTMIGVFSDATASTMKVDNNSPATMTLSTTNPILANDQLGMGLANILNGFTYGFGFMVTDPSSGDQATLAHNLCINSGSAAAPSC